jgi:hypothetical protein
MPDLLTPLTRLRPLLAPSHELPTGPRERPRTEPPSGPGPSWLLDYAAFLQEQRDNYCQAS